MVATSGSNPYAKEMVIRRRIANIFNKREEDFPTLRDYNDYLEQVEDMIFNLIEGIDVPAIEAKIAKYQAENAEQIINSRARRAEELAKSLAASKNQPQADESEQGTSQPSGHYAPALPGGAIVQPRPIRAVQHMIERMEGNGDEDEETLRIRAERTAKAGGWTQELNRKRALEEAFSSLCV